jgi:hypothetical protein
MTVLNVMMYGNYRLAELTKRNGSNILMLKVSFVVKGQQTQECIIHENEI